LPGLEVLAADGNAFFRGELGERGHVDGEIRCPVRERNAALEGGIGVDLGAIASELSRRPFSKASTSWWTSLGLKNVSVEAHQIMTARSAPVLFLT